LKTDQIQKTTTILFLSKKNTIEAGYKINLDITYGYDFFSWE